MTEPTDKQDGPSQIKDMAGVALIDGKLWGRAGGELEYVGQRIEWRPGSNRVQPVVVLLFTDHDHWPGDDGELEPGVFYRAEFPLASR